MAKRLQRFRIAGLLVAMWHACVRTSFVGWGFRFGTHCAPRQVQQFSGPMSIDIESYKDNFYEVAMAEAYNEHISVSEYLGRLLKRADSFLSRGELVDRGEFLTSIESAILSRGVMTVVLGGKSFGKSFVKAHAIASIQNRTSTDCTVVDIDMRSLKVKSMAQRVETQINAELNPSWRAKLSKVIAQPFSMAVAWAIAKSRAPATQPVSNAARDLMELLVKYDFSENMDKEIRKFTRDGRFLGIVIDEANRGLPQDGHLAEAQQVLSNLVGLTKQSRMASVVLISSEFGYPYRLQKLQFNLADIGTVIIAGEVEESVMKNMLRQDWGMGQALADLFFKYYGGLIHTSFLALRELIALKNRFNPFAVVELDMLRNCTRDPEAFEHLVNIAKQGYSFVENVVNDKGAELISSSGVGGIISNRARTFGLRDFFQGTTYTYAIIPSSFHNRLKICSELAKSAEAPAKHSDAVVITVTYNGTTQKIQFNAKDDGAAVKETICGVLRLAPGTPVYLTNADGVGVTISGNLAPGNYTLNTFA